MSTFKNGDLIVAKLAQPHGPAVLIPLLVVDFAPDGIWNDTPTIAGLYLGRLDEVCALMGTKEPQLLTSVYAPHPTRLCYSESSRESANEYLRWDLVHVHTHTYLPATDAALEHI
jgi:hypothetical protein